MLFPIAVFVLTVLGSGASRPSQQLFQNDAVQDGGMSMVRDIAFIVISFILFYVVITFDPSCWFNNKRKPKRKLCIHCLRCRCKVKWRNELKDKPALVTEVRENEHDEMQKAEGEEVREMIEKTDFTVKENSGDKEQEEDDQKEKVKVFRVEEEQLQEYEARLVENESNLAQREKFLQEMEHELVEKDMQRKLEKELWLKEEDERKKREEKQQTQKKEAEQRVKNEQERKKEEIRMRKMEECRLVNQEKDFQEEKSQVVIWEKEKNAEWKQKMLIVEKRERDFENLKQGVQQRELDLERRKQQKLERQGMFEALMNGKDERIKKRQLDIHQKGEQLKDRENNLLKLQEENCPREREHQEQHEECEVVRKRRDLMLLEREQEMRKRKRIVEMREHEVLERDPTVQNAGKLVEKNEEEVIEKTDDGLQQKQQKQHDVHQQPPERKCHHSSHSKLLSDDSAEIERRKNNLMFRGVKEGKGEHDKEVVAKLIKAMNLDIEPIRTFRVGHYIENRFRPMKVVFRCESDRNLVLTNNKKVRNLIDPSLWTKNIFITPDYTQQQREKQEMLLSDLDKKRESDPNGRYTIKGDKVVLLKKPQGKAHLRR